MSTNPIAKTEENLVEECLIEECLLDLFKRNGLDQAIIPGSPDIPHHFVQIVASVGGVLNWGAVPGQEELEPDLLGVNIVIELVTPRPPKTFITPIETLRVHERYLGRVRNLLRARNNPFANLAFHRIENLERQITSRVFDADMWADRTRQPFHGQLVKLPGAYPGNATPAA